MFDNTNHYTLRFEEDEDITRYFVSFTDGEDRFHDTEVSRPVYLKFLSFIKNERNLRRWDERHREQFDLTDEMIHNRALHAPKSVEDIVLDNLRYKQLRQAIQNLPEIQRRRFILYYKSGLTYVQIAQMEGCSARAVEYSVEIAKEKIISSL